MLLAGWKMSPRSGRFGTSSTRHLLKHPIEHTDVEVHMFIEAGAESMDEGHCTDVQVSCGKAGRSRCLS